MFDNMAEYQSKIGENGRMVIPKELREKCGLKLDGKDSAKWFVEESDGELKITVQFGRLAFRPRTGK